MKARSSTSDPLWYKDAVIYELPVKSFYDGNGDGIGDFAGLLQKLDYLQELGVTCLWLLPFFPSPMRDDGYDISDYRSIDPRYGTLDEFKTFLEAAHGRGMQVMIELVINHTSDQHPWFQTARQAPPGSPERDFYVWSSTDQKFRGARIIFTDTESSNWTWDPAAKAYYWHRFFSHQPDLNYDNPAVLDEVTAIMRFWLDLGVDALRLDAIPYLVEREDTTCENLPETHAVIRKIRAAMDQGYENRMILAEANQWPSDVLPYFGDGDECHMAFHFPLMPRLFMGLRLEDRHPITEIMGQTPRIPDNCQWGIFLRNHDELTLEMVSDEERDYMYLAYSADPRMRVNVGIRRRLAPLVENNRLRIELLSSVLFSFPGTPILYYGDELGMGDNIYLGDRNGVRTPMQWSADRNAGFSRATPARLYSPVIMDPVYGYESTNVEAQQGDPSSLLTWMRNMIALRKLFQVFGRGTMEFLHPSNRKVLAYVRSYEKEKILCLANLSRFAQPIRARLVALRRHGAHRNARLRRVSSDSQDALSSDPGSLRASMVRAATRVRPQRAERGADHRGRPGTDVHRVGRRHDWPRASRARPQDPCLLGAPALVRWQGTHHRHGGCSRVGGDRRSGCGAHPGRRALHGRRLGHLLDATRAVGRRAHSGDHREAPGSRVRALSERSWVHLRCHVRRPILPMAADRDRARRASRFFGGLHAGNRRSVLFRPARG